MAITLYHNPFTRAASVVWQLEEVGVPYDLVYVDLRQGQHKTPARRAKNQMAKLPVLEDGDSVVSETAAIGLYLADRYALGTLAPALDDARRGPYLRLCLIPAAVIEPASMAKSSGWAYNPGNAGFGTFEDMLTTCREAIGQGPWLFGEQFTMADVVFGATLRYMLRFKMMPSEPVFADYVARASARPAAVRADEKNAAVAKAQGLA